MNIAIISVGVYKKKGFSRNIALAHGLVRLGNHVTLLTCNDKLAFRREELKGVNVVAFPELLSYRLAKGGLGILDTISRIIYLAFINFDIVHVDVGFRPSGGIPGHLYAKLKNVPYVCDWWDWIGKGGNLDGRSLLYRLTLGGLDNFFEVFEKRYADGIVTISKCLQDRAVSVGISREKTTIIHGGADTDGAEFIDKHAVRRELGLDTRGLLLGFAGMGQFECEDLLPFLECVPELKRAIKEFHWFSTGDRLPEKYRNQYKVGEEYLELGWVDSGKYMKYLQAADILLLPLKDNLTSRARWPNKMGDYLVAGRPVVATAVGEIGRFYEAYPDGIALVSWDSDSVLDAILKLNSDSERMEAMGRYNFNVAKEEYSWDKKAAEFDAFYRRILADKKNQKKSPGK